MLHSSVCAFNKCTLNFFEGEFIVHVCMFCDKQTELRWNTRVLLPGGSLQFPETSEVLQQKISRLTARLGISKIWSGPKSDIRRGSISCWRCSGQGKGRRRRKVHFFGVRVHTYFRAWVTRLATLLHPLSPMFGWRDVLLPGRIHLHTDVVSRRLPALAKTDRALTLFFARGGLQLWLRVHDGAALGASSAAHFAK